LVRQRALIGKKIKLTRYDDIPSGRGGVPNQHIRISLEKKSERFPAVSQEAKPSQILISTRVLLAIDKSVTVEPVGEFALKGIRRPMRLTTFSTR
jgi:hypothetical protein